MEKNKKYIVKGAGVLLIAAVLLFTSVAVIADTVQEQKIDPRFFKGTGSGIVNGDEAQSADEPLFSQLPFEPYEQWSFHTSDAGPGYTVYDNYWNVSEEICDIHWWGLSLVFTGSGWANCDPAGMCFRIVFYDDLLGQAICEYSDICPPAVSTGKFYEGFEMFYWETIFEPCCDQIPDGWVSIQSYSNPNGCWFLWAGSTDGDLYAYQDGSSEPDLDNDLAFELTPAGPPPVPAICCTAVGMSFGDVEPGQNVTGQIKVCNCGDVLSFLNWHVDTTNVPTWATWKFIPEDGTDLLEPNCVVIDVEATITDAEGEYTGTITVFNSDDTNDKCTISTSANVIVPRARTVYNPLFANLLQQFPALYLIIKIILGV